MAMISGLTRSQVEHLAARANPVGLVECSNYNSPEKTIVSGTEAGVTELCRLARLMGAQTQVLKVSAPFHTTLLKEPGRLMEEALRAVSFKAPTVPYLPNVTARPYEGEPLPGLLNQHIWKPVRWEETVKHLLNDGTELIVEIGPGRSLTRYNGEIAAHYGSSVILHSVQTLADILDLEQILKGETV